jgi:hypothetical protein
MKRARRGVVAGLLAVLVVGFATTTGCGILNAKRTSFPYAGLGDEGEGLFLDDIEEIVQDTELTTDEMREALRNDLGIEDEDLLDALLGL